MAIGYNFVLYFHSEVTSEAHHIPSEIRVRPSPDFARAASQEMSVFRTGLKIGKGATLDELEISDSDSSEDDVNAQTEEDTESENDEEEERTVQKSAGSKSVKKSAISQPVAEKNNVRKRGKDQLDNDEESENEEEEARSGSEAEASDDPNNIEYPVTCALCNRVLFNLAAVNQHMQSKAHIKKEAEMSKTDGVTLSEEKIQKLKARSDRKRQRRLERKQAERAVRGHVWGAHVKPDKGVPAPAAAEGGKGRKKPEKSTAAQLAPRTAEPSLRERSSKGPPASPRHKASEGKSGGIRRKCDVQPQKRRKSVGLSVD